MRTTDLIDLKPYFHGTTNLTGAPICFGSFLPYTPVAIKANSLPASSNVNPSVYGHGYQCCLNPGIASLSIIVSKTIYLAFDNGFTNEIKLAKGKPIQGTIIDHASTHRCRYTRSSIGSWLSKSSQSNFLGLSTNPSMVIDQGLVLRA